MTQPVPAGRLEAVSTAPSPSIGPRTTPRRDPATFATNRQETSGLTHGREISLATIDPGEIYWQRFGHNTLVVADAGEIAAGVSYNFGYFDFEQPDFLPRFLRGRMLYQALALPATADLDGYVEERRSVHLQRLNLSPAQADRLAAALARAVRPENRDYLYEYFRANCSTRLRDALDEALDGELRRLTQGRSRGLTYRMHARRMAQGNFWLAAGIDLGLGPDTDRGLSFWEEMFLPDRMRHYLEELVLADGRKLVADSATWYDSGKPGPGDGIGDWRLPFALAGLALAIALLWLGRRAQSRTWARRTLAAVGASLHAVLGIAGLVLALLWIGTDHIAAHRNENLFLLSPLSLVMAGWWLGRLRSGARSRVGDVVATLVAASAVLALLSKTLPFWFIQANLHWCLLLLPVQLALWRNWLRQR